MPGPVSASSPARPVGRTVGQRVWVGVSSAGAVVLGVVPHVLHHVGLFAGPSEPPAPWGLPPQTTRQHDTGSLTTTTHTSSDRPAEMVATGGYPAVLDRTDARRARFFESYVDTIVQRDLSTIARVHDQANVRRLLSAIPSTSAALLNFDSLARALRLPANTLRLHATLLDTLFLTTRLEAWSTNLLSRVVKTPRAYITDSGLLCHLVGADTARLVGDGSLAGMAFETFAAMELHRQIAWQDNPPRLFHYRDRDGHEVELVLERRDGSVAAVEVKTAASASSSDFRGLRHLREKLGTRFNAGVLLYTGEHTVPFEDRLAAVPLSGLWCSSA